jgi:DNA-binding CsgD family transcriptional regulator
LLAAGREESCARNQVKGSIDEVVGIMTNSQLNLSIGVLLLDAQLRLVHHTSEAATILEYPGKPLEIIPLDKVLPAVRSHLQSPPTAASAPLEFMSGRRRYQCRAYLLDTNGRGSRSEGEGSQPKIVVVLERVFPQTPDITRWCEGYQLTPRECETVRLLIKGLTSKEIADQMGISASTVKSFLKLIMTKVGVSSRTAIIAKIVDKSP